MKDFLNINTPVVFDEFVAHYDDHKHLPITSLLYGNNHEIRSVVKNQDVFTLINKNVVPINDQISKNDRTKLAPTELVNLGVNHPFEKIIYQLNGVPIDECKNTGITTLMKTYLSKSPNQVP